MHIMIYIYIHTYVYLCMYRCVCLCVCVELLYICEDMSFRIRVQHGTSSPPCPKGFRRAYMDWVKEKSDESNGVDTADVNDGDFFQVK